MTKELRVPGDLESIYDIGLHMSGSDPPFPEGGVAEMETNPLK